VKEAETEKMEKEDENKNCSERITDTEHPIYM